MTLAACSVVFSVSGLPSSNNVPRQPGTTATNPTTGPAGNGFDITSLIGKHAYQEPASSLMRQYGCHAKQGAAGSELCPSAGLIIEESISSDLIMGTTMVVSATSDEQDPSHFATYAGVLPFGMSWSQSRADVESMLTGRFGQPVNVFDGGPGSYVSEEYTVTGLNYAGLTVWISNSTSTLIRVMAELDPPIAMG